MSHGDEEAAAISDSLLIVSYHCYKYNYAKCASVGITLELYLPNQQI